MAAGKEALILIISILLLEQLHILKCVAFKGAIIFPLHTSLNPQGLATNLKKEALQFTYCFYFRGRQLFAISPGIVEFKLILPNHKEANKQIQL